MATAMTTAQLLCRFSRCFALLTQHAPVQAHRLPISHAGVNKRRSKTTAFSKLLSPPVPGTQKEHLCRVRGCIDRDG